MRKECLSKKNIEELREIAVKLGVDRKRTYGTSKQALVIIIDNAKKGIY